MNEEMIQIQFKIPRTEYEAAKKYLGEDAERHYFARNAFREKITRMEGRDSDATKERLEKDAAWLQRVLDSGKVKVPR